MKKQVLKNILTEERFLLFLILIISFFVLIPISGFDFLSWDDNMIITQNPFVQNLSMGTIVHNFTFETFTFLTYTVFSLIYKIWGENPFPFHLFSVIVHLINIVLVYKLLKFFPFNKWIIFIVCLLFAIHPTRIESIAWISETKGLLFGFFALLSFISYVKYLNSELKTRFYIFTSVFVILASLSKIQGLLLPFTFILFDIYFQRKMGFFLFFEKIILFVLLISLSNPLMIKLVTVIFLFFVIVKSRIKEQNMSLKLSIAALAIVVLFYISFMQKINTYFAFFGMDADGTTYFSMIERFMLAGKSLAIYFKNLLMPISLSAIYPYPHRLSDGNLPDFFLLWLSVIVLCIAISVVLILRRKKINPIFIFGWFFFLINVSLVLHIIPIEGRIIAADRYTYIPYLGFFMIIAYAFDRMITRLKLNKNQIRIISISMLVLLAPLSYSRSKVWVNTKTLFTDVIQKKPNVAFAYSVIGASYMKQNLPDSAILFYNKAIEFAPNDPIPYYNRAIAYNAKSQYDSAINNYEKFIQYITVDKNKAAAYANIGEIYRNKGADSLALVYFNTAIKLDDKLSVAYNRRGLYYLGINNLDNALKDFSKAIENNQFNAEALNNLGLTFMMKKNYIKAEDLFNQAIELNNNYALAYDNRAYLKYLRTDYQGAIQDYNMEIEITPNYISAYISRGRVYAAMQNFEKAISDFNIAIENDTLLKSALTNRAFAYYYSGSINKAETDFTGLVVDYPQDVQVWQNLAWFYSQNNRALESVDCLLKVLEIDDKLEPTYVNIGRLYIELNALNLAEHYLEMGLNLNSENSEILFLLGETNRLKGFADKACDFYRNAAKLNNEFAIQAVSKYCGESGL
jgi:tetratricopeptide (TPR) repeat protein